MARTDVDDYPEADSRAATMARRGPSITEETKELDRKLERLQVTVAELGERLHPILSPVNEATDKKDPGPTAPERSEMVEHLAELGYRVTRINALVQELIERTEI